MWRLMLVLVVGDGEPAKSVIAEFPTRQLCAVAAHNHRAQAIKGDVPGTIRAYWCAPPEAKS